MADLDHNGVIDREEFTLLLKSEAGLFNQSRSDSSNMISEKEGDELFKEADKHNDEAISLQEIGTMLNIVPCKFAGESSEVGNLTGESSEVGGAKSSATISETSDS